MVESDDHDAHRRFCDSLTEEERVLVSLRDELYGGSWGSMRRDLEDRVAGRAYIFRLANRIREERERHKPGYAIPWKILMPILIPTSLDLSTS